MKSPTLAALLERGTRAPLVRAALTVLLSLWGLYDRQDVTARWYDIHPERGAHPSFALVRWDVVASDADRGTIPMSTGERAALLLAASLASGHRVDLAELLPLVDEERYATLTMALYSILRRRDPVTSAWDELRFAGQADRDHAAPPRRDVDQAAD